MRTRTLMTALAAIVALTVGSSKGQEGGPQVPELRERSGLFTRISPILPRLPVDRDRDLFYGSRWEPRHPWRRGLWVDSYKDGGLYGLPLSAGCTSCRSPFFRGSPGVGTVDESCRPPSPVGRVLGNIVHPFRPVDTYYSGGCYVPVYDLDPLVPGPGWFPWWAPDFSNKPTGG